MPRLGGRLPISTCVNDEHWELDRAREWLKRIMPGKRSIIDKLQTREVMKLETRMAALIKTHDHTGADKGHTLTEKSRKREKTVSMRYLMRQRDWWMERRGQ